MEIYKLDFKGYNNNSELSISSIELGPEHYLKNTKINFAHLISQGFYICYNVNNMSKNVYINASYVDINISNNYIGESFFEYMEYYHYIRRFKRNDVIDEILT